MSKRFACLILLTSILLGGMPSYAENLLGERAPDFALRSIDGPNLRLSEFRSEVVLLTFWADWCGKCRAALPMLNALNERYASAGLQMLAVDVEGDPEHTRKFAKANSVTFPVLTDTDQNVSRIYGLNQMPMAVLLDREGNMRHVHAGFKGDIDAILAAQLEALLAE
jgi:peroxiredoxin